MIVAALDSTTPQGSVAVSVPGRDVVVRAGDAGRGWSQRLPGDLLVVLEEARLTLADIDLFAVAAGPGSLTGLRVGLATIQGLALATSRPVVPISALEALADHAAGSYRGRHVPQFIAAWANALRGEVFTALYRTRPDLPAHADLDPIELVQGPAVYGPAEAVAACHGATGGLPLVVIGDVEGPLVEPFAAIERQAVTFIARPLLAPVLADIARRRQAQGHAVAPHAVHPLYVRVPDAVLARERARQATPPHES